MNGYFLHSYVINRQVSRLRCRVAHHIHIPCVEKNENERNNMKLKTGLFSMTYSTGISHDKNAPVVNKTEHRGVHMYRSTPQPTAEPLEFLFLTDSEGMVWAKLETSSYYPLFSPQKMPISSCYTPTSDFGRKSPPVGPYTLV